MKKILSILMSVFILTSISIGSINAFAAATPSLASTISSCTLYNNDSNNNSRSIVIKVNGYNKNYSYHAKSNNKSVATVSGSANSRTGVTVTINAKSRGTTSIIVYIVSPQGKTVSSCSIDVSVKSRSISTPTSLKMTASTSNSIAIKWSVSSTLYISNYRVEFSKYSDFRNYQYLTTKSNNARITGLSAGTRYYIRVKAVSNCNAGDPIVTTSSTIRVITK